MSDYGKVTAVVAVASCPEMDEKEKVDEYRQALDRLEKLCHAVVVNHGGTVTRLPSAFGAGDSFEIEVPADNVSCIREIVDRSVDECRVNTVAGLGHDIQEAKVAADNALRSDSDILVYHPDMDDMSKYEEEDFDLKKAEDPMSEAKKILAEIKQNAELYEQVRLKNPEAYRAVVDTLQGLVQAVAAQKQDEANDVKEANVAQRTMDIRDKKHDTDNVRQSKEAMKDVVASTPVREASPQQESSEPTPPSAQTPRMSPQILQGLIDQTKKRYMEQKTGSMAYDGDIESQDFSGREDPEFSKSLMYVIEHGSLYG
jgi:hypothetical protein